MEWLNYHHLHYFWVITQEGSLSRAASRLKLTHSTLSFQLKVLESFFGHDLFERRGRRLLLTEFGSEVAQYCGDIFRLGEELVESSRGRLATRKAVFRVGVLGSIPKTIIYRLLEAALEPAGLAPVEVRQGEMDLLLGMLSRNSVQAILTDQPAREAMGQRIHAHKLGDTEIALYASPSLANRYRDGFPGSLAGAPMLLPVRGSGLRQSIDRWLADNAIKVRVVAEIDDAALLRAFGAFGKGVFPVRTVLADEVEETHRVRLVGQVSGMRESYYVISKQRRVTHPPVLAMVAAAKSRLLDPIRS
jgi:LysR family transcriptional activator of nhaA